jgi:hypothetical protein
MLERLLVGVIVLVATVYSTWALLPSPARQRLAQRIAALPAAAWLPGWLRPHLRSAASRPAPSGDPCDGCSAHKSPDESKR